MSRATCSKGILVVAMLGAVFAAGCAMPSGDGVSGDGGNGNGTGPVDGSVSFAARVYGQVFDASDDRGLAGVSITTDGLPLSAETDADGRFVIEVLGGGNFALTARKDGYTYAQRRAAVEEGGLSSVADMCLTPVDPAVIRIGPAGGSGANSDGSKK